MHSILQRNSTIFSSFSRPKLTSNLLGYVDLISSCIPYTHICISYICECMCVQYRLQLPAPPQLIFHNSANATRLRIQFLYTKMQKVTRRQWQRRSAATARQTTAAVAVAVAVAAATIDKKKCERCVTAAGIFLQQWHNFSGRHAKCKMP